MRNVPLTSIRIDGGTQPREEIDQATVDEYAESMLRLEEFPPLVVYHDGVSTWLADGFHRYHAAKKASWQAVDVDWREGTLEMAKLYAAGANAQHGKPRTGGDKRRAIEMVRSTDDGRRWTQEKIAKHCHVSQQYVSKALGGSTTGSNPPKNPPLRQPTVREQKRTAVEAAVQQRPEASDREIARETGVDRETVAKIRHTPTSTEPKRESASARQEPALRSEPVGSRRPAMASLKDDFPDQNHRDAVRLALTTIETAVAAWPQREVEALKNRIFVIFGAANA